MVELPPSWAPVEEFLASHPSYNGVFKASVEQVLYGEGPLTCPMRHYLALMAAARHRCAFLMELHRAEFLAGGGEAAWLAQGLKGAPSRLQKLDSLNRLMAHQPWTISRAHLARLTKGGPESWSLSELMQGATILSLTHALASFVTGCGIISSQPPSPKDPSPNVGGDKDENAATNVSKASEVELLMARMKAVADEETTEELSPEEKAKQFAQVIAADAHRALGQGSSSSPGHSPPISPPAVRPPSASSLSPTSPPPLYTEDPNLFQYVDFVKRPDPTSYPTFKIHDYSWEDEGYSLVSQLYAEMAEHMDGKFRLARSLTYQTMGQYLGVDTSPFRTALWNYVQSLFGIRHDDYDYSQINSLLRRPTKELVKTVCCSPHKCTEALRAGVMTEFLHSERVHVILLVSEARQQSELLYFLRAVSRLMTS